MTTHDVSSKLADASLKVLKFSWGNKFSRKATDLTEKYTEWVHRDAKAYRSVNGKRTTALAASRAAESRGALVRSSGRTIAWTAVDLTVGAGTIATRFVTGLAGYAAWTVAVVPLGIVGTLAAALPIAVASGAVELVHGAQLSAKAAGRWAKGQYSRFIALGKTAKTADAPAAAEPAVEVTGTVVEAGPALASPVVETPAVATPAVAEPAVAAVAPVAAAPAVAAPAAPATRAPQDLGL